MTNKAQKEHHQKISKKCQTCLVASVALVLSLGLVKMVLSNRASNWGQNLNIIKLETSNLKKQNLKLKSDIIKQTGGLNGLAIVAKKRGFVDKPNYKYFTTGPSVAQVLP